MNVVGKVGSLITQGVYSVATPFHPFGGAVDIIAVQQQDGSYKSTPWYVRFGKFQGVLKEAEKVVRIEVNGVEANFHMYLDNSGEAYFVREVVSDKHGETNVGLQSSDSFRGTQEDEAIDQIDSHTSGEDHCLSGDERYGSNTGEFQLRDEHVALGVDRLEMSESDGERPFYDFQDVQSSFEGSAELSEYDSSRYENLDLEHVIESQNSSSEVVLVSVDGHILTAPISSSERNTDDVELNTTQFHLGPGEGKDFCEGATELYNGESAWAADYLTDPNTSENGANSAEYFHMNNDSNGYQPQPQICGGDREDFSQAEETSDTVNLDVELQMDSSLEYKFAGTMKEDVFQSCLELPQLAMHDGSSSQHDTGSSLEILKVAENMQDNPSQRYLAVDERDVNFGKSRIENGVSLSNAGTSGITQLEELPMQGETPGKNVFDLDISCSDSISNHVVGANVQIDKKFDVVHDYQVPPQDENSRLDNLEPQTTSFGKDAEINSRSVEISLCKNLLHSGMGLSAAAEAFDTHRISEEEFRLSASSIVESENLVVRVKGKYLPWDKAAPVVLGMAVYGVELAVKSSDVISVEHEDKMETRKDESGISSTPSGRGWRLWPIPFRRVKTIDHTNSNSLNEDVVTDSESGSQNRHVEGTLAPHGIKESPRKQLMRTNVPTSDQIASLNLKEGRNMVTFISTSRVLGPQKVEAHIYLWKWNARIVISDVDGTITKSDVLGQFMPLVGKDWTHSGIAHLFSAIKENGYQLLFLSARAIVQAYLTRSFLFNLKQDGKTLPDGPVVISPDGLFPSLFREVIRRAPHEFKIACLEDIKSLFPPDYNPFYAGFGNRDTDELSYRKIGIPKGKIFIINPKGEVAINHRIDVRSYTSLHTLVNDMFPPTSLVEQEDFNSWNYWKMPLPDIDA